MSAQRITSRPRRVITSYRSWRARIESDAAHIDSCVPANLRELHDAVVERAEAGGAGSLILSGSTARGSRMAISDLDYHLIGAPIDTTDLSRELDLHVLSVEELETHPPAGDDFIHWSLRFGLVVFTTDPPSKP